MSRFWLFVLIPVLFAQTPAARNQTDLFHKAPPAVDEALRARIDQFFQLHVEGKFRQAETLVAEESKENFYSANKTKCLSFEIKDIAYSDEFTKAKATVVCTMFVMVPGFANKPLPVPLPSYWKVVNGEWFEYSPPTSRRMPFGNQEAKPGAGSPAAGMPASPLPMDSPQQTFQALYQQVKADRNAVELKKGEDSSATVTISNGMPGPIKLSLLVPKVPGLEARLDREALGPKANAVVTIKCTASKTARQPVTLAIQVSPTGQEIPIRVTFVQ